MTRDDTQALLSYCKQTAHRFFIDPATAVNSWHKKLEKYTRKETVEAVDYIVASNNVPAVSSITAYIDRQRHNERMAVQNARGDEWRRKADESFKDIPGRNRTEQVLCVCAQQSAKHWIAGERDNDHFNGKLLAAQRIGVEFDGVDYSKVTVKDKSGDEFDRMRVGG